MPREGHDDGMIQTTMDYYRHFNPRAPRGARRTVRRDVEQMQKFQSTCPARGTTKNKEKCVKRVDNFNPRAPRGARRRQRQQLRGAPHISIHVPREGHDELLDELSDRQREISIHVPREGHDRRGCRFQGR